jgi:hypothetical protein
MILTGETELLGEKPVPVPLSTTNPGLHRDKSASNLARSLKPQVHDIQEFKSYLTVNIQRFN